MNPSIVIDKITFSWPGKEPLFEDYSLDLARGESLSVIGSSGSGKSSLLTLLAGLEKPTKGSIMIDGRPLERPRPATGLIIQDLGLLPWASLRENAALGPRLGLFYGPDGRHVPKHAKARVTGRRARFAADMAVVDSWLDRLGIAEVADSFPARVSGGQRQRAAIARTLVLSPDLLLMDEPFAALDEATREGLRKLVLGLRRELAMTLVLVTHSIDEALIMGDRVLVLGSGTNREAIILDNYDKSPERQARTRAEVRRRLGTP